MTNYSLLAGLFASFGELSQFVINGDLSPLAVLSRHNWRFIASLDVGTQMPKLVEKTEAFG